MALPWLQLVQLVPSIVDVSRELLKRNRPAPDAGPPRTDAELAARIAALEDNERRQAELVSQMAEQLAKLTEVATALRRQLFWLTGIAGAAIILALLAIGLRST